MQRIQSFQITDMEMAKKRAPPRFIGHMHMGRAGFQASSAPAHPTLHRWGATLHRTPPPGCRPPCTASRQLVCPLTVEALYDV